jgi:hypothetical protein
VRRNERDPPTLRGGEGGHDILFHDSYSTPGKRRFGTSSAFRKRLDEQADAG